MPDVAKRIVGPVQLGTSATTLYTCPASTICHIRSIQVANATAGAVTFTLSVGADAAGTRIYPAVPLDANDLFDWSGLLVLTAGEIIQAYSNTASAVTLVISAVESS